MKFPRLHSSMRQDRRLPSRKTSVFPTSFSDTASTCWRNGISSWRTSGSCAWKLRRGKVCEKNVDELHYRGRSLLPLGIVLSIRMGRPAVAITSPSSLKVTIKLPRYLPNANAWTTGTILPDDCFTKVGYGPCGSSIDGAGPVKES